MFPELYDQSDGSAAAQQRKHFGAIVAEYSCLTSIAIAGMLDLESRHASFLFALLLLLLITVTITRHVNKFEEKWYRCRALAESVKTSSWRYMMRAQPFDDTDNVEQAKHEFSLQLNRIYSDNKDIATTFKPTEEFEPQITDEMDRIRKLNIDERLKTYLEQRVANQKKWYANKSKWNKNKSNFWFVCTIVVYISLAWTIAADVISVGENWPLVSFAAIIASCMLGWVRAKRFGELSSSYLLTSREIGKIQRNALLLKSACIENKLSEFVNDAELAFSREHTQWAARREH